MGKKLQVPRFHHSGAPRVLLLHDLFTSKTVFQLILSVACIKLQILLRSCLIQTYQYQHTERLFISTIFLPMSKLPSIYVAYMLSFFHFRLYFRYDLSNNLTKTGKLVFLDIFWNISNYFWMITWIKNVNNIQIAKVQFQGVV